MALCGDNGNFMSMNEEGDIVCLKKSAGPTEIVKVSQQFRKNLDDFGVDFAHIACPKYSELGSFGIKAYLYVSDGSRR